MANEFKHADPGAELTKTEYTAVLGHVLDSQARGDIIISNTAGTGLIRIAKGADNTFLTMNANDPEWAAVIEVDDTTDSTSGSTGSIFTAGGLGVTKNIVTNAQLDVEGYAPIGNENALDANETLTVGRTFAATGGATAVQLAIRGSTTTSTTADWGASSLWVQPVTTVLGVNQGAGAWVSTAEFREPAIDLNANTVVDAATVVIKSAPTEATNNYALLVGGGESQFRGEITQNFASGEDTAAMEYRSSDVAHGLTTASGVTINTDSWLTILKNSASEGGGRTLRVSEGTNAANDVVVVSGTVNSTKSTGFGAAAETTIYHHDGADTLDNMTSDGNIFGIVTKNAGGSVRGVFLLDEDGDLFLDAGSGTAVTAMHDEHDMALMHATNISLGRLKQGDYELAPVTKAYLDYSKDLMEERGIIAYGTGEVLSNGREDSTTVNLRNGLYFAWDLGFWVGERQRKVIDILMEHATISNEGQAQLAELATPPPLMLE